MKQKTYLDKLLENDIAFVMQIVSQQDTYYIPNMIIDDNGIISYSTKYVHFIG